MPRIVVGHEMDLVTRGALQVVDACYPRNVVAEYHLLAEMLKQIERDLPDIIICSEHIDPAFHAVTLLDQLQSHAPKARIIFIGAAHDGRLMRDLLHSGLGAYLHEGDPLCTCLPAALETVLRNRPYLSPTANTEYLIATQSTEKYWGVDDEARRVLQLLAAGETVARIALELQVSRRHIYWICEKLRRRFGATTSAHLISCALAEGYASASE